MNKQQNPEISIIPPGPGAKEWVKRDKRVISQSYTRSYPLVVEKAKGAWLWDIDGNSYLDFTAGLSVNSTGHCHPEIVDAIKEQCERFIHMSGTDFYYPAEICLAERMTAITPGRYKKKVFFSTSGAESIEAAMKLARYYTKRPLFISFYGSFHGRTMGALSLSGSKAIHRRHFSPLVSGVTHVPYAYCYRCHYNLRPDDCEVYCVKWIEEELFKTTLPPEEAAAIFVEPIQGEGGYIVPPDNFLKSLKQLAEKYDILLIADEIQSGMGRTGRMFASEHFNCIPDIITIAKGIASGLPLGITVANAKIMNWESGSHANTFGGNPISCEAAITTINLLENGLIKNSFEMGEYILSRLEILKNRYSLIGDVRGKGLMIGIEIVKDKETKEMGIKERNKIVTDCFKKGLLILGCGQNIIRFMPPLIITKKEADTALSIFEEVISLYN